MATHETIQKLFGPMHNAMVQLLSLAAERCELIFDGASTAAAFVVPTTNAMIDAALPRPAWAQQSSQGSFIVIEYESTPDEQVFAYLKGYLMRRICPKTDVLCVASAHGVAVAERFTGLRTLGFIDWETDVAWLIDESGTASTYHSLQSKGHTEFVFKPADGEYPIAALEAAAELATMMTAVTAAKTAAMTAAALHSPFASSAMPSMASSLEGLLEGSPSSSSSAAGVGAGTARMTIHELEADLFAECIETPRHGSSLLGSPMGPSGTTFAFAELSDKAQALYQAVAQSAKSGDLQSLPAPLNKLQLQADDVSALVSAQPEDFAQLFVDTVRLGDHEADARVFQAVYKVLAFVLQVATSLLPDRAPRSWVLGTFASHTGSSLPSPVVSTIHTLLSYGIEYSVFKNIGFSDMALMPKHAYLDPNAKASKLYLVTTTTSQRGVDCALFAYNAASPVLRINNKRQMTRLTAVLLDMCISMAAEAMQLPASCREALVAHVYAQDEKIDSLHLEHFYKFTTAKADEMTPQQLAYLEDVRRRVQKKKFGRVISERQGGIRVGKEYQAKRIDAYKQELEQAAMRGIHRSFIDKIVTEHGGAVY